MARARVVLPLPRSPFSKTASPGDIRAAIAAPNLAVAARSGSATVMRNLSAMASSSPHVAGRERPLRGGSYHASPRQDFRGKSMAEHIVIIGAGQAGVQAVQSLR